MWRGRYRDELLSNGFYFRRQRGAIDNPSELGNTFLRSTPSGVETKLNCKEL